MSDPDTAADPEVTAALRRYGLVVPEDDLAQITTGRDAIRHLADTVAAVPAHDNGCFSMP